MKALRALPGVVLALLLAGAGAAPLVDAARGPAPVLASPTPPRLGNAINDDQRVPRSHRWQPPVIPHRIDGYQIDRNFNKCMDCHAREKTAFTQAVPVSATHYVGRSGQVLEHVSTRRYFCLQCHVAQENVPPIVGNGFRGDPATATPLK